MAVAPTGAIYKALEFDGVSSRTYGIYITGEAVYNAPERDVEMITIPGRSGSFALDAGRFENITVTYPAGIFAETEADFRDAISEFRNFLCSRKGYVRLKDEYNPNEYRMAVYKSGLEVEPAMLKAGEFKITFDCKPQRWLVSGETAITIGEWGETETATGDIVEVENPDGLLGVKALSVSLEPIQDLNGYDKPWSGGNGKNLLNVGGRVSQTTAEVVYTSDENYIIGNGTKSGGGYVNFTTLAMTLEAGTYYTRRFVISGTASNTVDSYITDGTTNIVGISASSENSFTLETQTTVYPRLAVWADGTVLTNYKIGIVISKTSGIDAYSPYSNICPISGRTEVETVVSPTTSAEDGTTYTTALGRTVYGGTLDVVSGELVVDRAMVDLGTLNWTYRSNFGVFSVAPQPTAKDKFNATCSAYPYGGAYSDLNDKECGYIYNNQISVKDSDYTDATAFKTAMSGVQLVYELAEPQTYQLTPQEVELLTGQNNVWSDGGDVTLEYGLLPNLLINPTLFESGPLLEVEGTGDITFNGSDITIQAVVLGAVQVYGGYISTSTNPNHIWFDMDMSRLNIGDAVTISGVQVNNNLGLTSNWPTVKFDNLNITEAVDIASYAKGPLGSRDSYVNYTPNNFTFFYGTPATSSTSTIKAYMSAHGPNSEGFSYTRTFTYYADYDGNEHIDIYLTYTTYSYFPQTSKAFIPAIMGDSTVSTLPTPVYIDLDIGEAYGEYSGVIASVNNAVILPAELPTLAPGSNAITFDNTITDLKVTPRWWKV